MYDMRMHGLIMGRIEDMILNNLMTLTINFIKRKKGLCEGHLMETPAAVLRESVTVNYLYILYSLCSFVNNKYNK